VTPSLETARLLLRPLALEDAGQVQVIFPRWEIVRHMTALVPWPYPPDGALAFYRYVALPAVARGEAWHWTLRLRDAPDGIIGAVSLQRAGEQRGFWVGLPWQGRGLAGEACDAVTTYWFEVLRMPSLRVEKAAANEPSRRISLRQGMRLVGVSERDFVGGRLPAETWELDAETWRARRARIPRLGPI